MTYDIDHLCCSYLKSKLSRKRNRYARRPSGLNLKYKGKEGLSTGALQPNAMCSLL